MTVPASSTTLRCHVDAVLDPIYETLFAALDLLVVHLEQPRPEDARTAELRALLCEELGRLDHTEG